MSLDRTFEDLAPVGPTSGRTPRTTDDTMDLADMSAGPADHLTVRAETTAATGLHREGQWRWLTQEIGPRKPSFVATTGHEPSPSGIEFCPDRSRGQP